MDAIFAMHIMTREEKDDWYKKPPLVSYFEQNIISFSYFFFAQTVGSLGQGLIASLVKSTHNIRYLWLGIPIGILTSFFAVGGAFTYRFPYKNRRQWIFSTSFYLLLSTLLIWLGEFLSTLTIA